jgi:hypothetical protein
MEGTDVRVLAAESGSSFRDHASTLTTEPLLGSVDLATRALLNYFC